VQEMVYNNPRLFRTLFNKLDQKYADELYMDSYYYSRERSSRKVLGGMAVGVGTIIGASELAVIVPSSVEAIGATPGQFGKALFNHLVNIEASGTLRISKTNSM